MLMVARQRWMALMALLLLLGPAGAAGADEQSAVLRIRADEWYPINGKPQAERPGFAIEILRQIMRPHGVTLDYRIMPWERSVATVRAGLADCVIGAFRGDAPDFLFSDQALGRGGIHLYVRRGDDFRYVDPASLDGIEIGVIGGYSYGPELDAYLEARAGSGVQVVKANNGLEQNIRKLLGGRIRATPELDLVMQSKLDEIGRIDDVLEAGAVNEAQPMYLACAPSLPSSAEFIARYDQGIVQLRQNGELQLLMQRYGLQDWAVGASAAAR